MHQFTECKISCQKWNTVCCSFETVFSGRKSVKVISLALVCSVGDLEFQLVAGKLRSIKVAGTWFRIVPDSWLNNELAACNSSLSFYSTQFHSIFTQVAFEVGNCILGE